MIINIDLADSTYDFTLNSFGLNQAPTNLQFDLNKSSYTAGETLSLTNAWLFDADGSTDLQRVDMWLRDDADGTWTNLFDVTTFTPWSGNSDWGSFNYDLDLTGYQAGSYTLWGIGSDSSGVTSNSVTKTFEVTGVNTAPTNLQFNLNKSSYTAGETLSLTNAWLFDADGSTDLQRVDMWLRNDADGTWTNLSDVTTFTPWSGNSDWGSFNYDLDLTGYQAGSYTLWGIGSDSSGVTSNSVTKTFEVTNSGSFNSTYGYGLVNAARAVAKAIGQNTFSDVANLGGNLWGNDLVKAPEVWARGYTGQNVVVAVLDTGVDYNHSDLANNIWTNTGEIAGDGIDNDLNGYVDDVIGWDFAYNDNNPNDIQSHGTHVAGTIAGLNNGIGITGVAYNAQIMPVKVLGDTGSGSFQNIADGIRYAADNGADVINLSLGGPSSLLIRNAIEYAQNQGAVVVMAAGNSGLSEPGYPARYATDFGISVGAVDINGQIASFSNRAGLDPSLNHVVAPGVSIYSTIPGGGYSYKNGTSMATPHVAGVVALMLSANPNLTPSQVIQMITNSTNSAGTQSLTKTFSNTETQSLVSTFSNTGTQSLVSTFSNTGTQSLNASGSITVEKFALAADFNDYLPQNLFFEAENNSETEELKNSIDSESTFVAFRDRDETIKIDSFGVEILTSFDNIQELLFSENWPLT